MEFIIWGYSLEAWQFYLSLGILFMGLEILAPGFVLFPIGVAFALTALFALKISSITVQLAILGVLLIAIFYLFRRFLPKEYHEKIKTGVDDLIGKTVVVEEAISDDGQHGYVKLYGDSWRALSKNEQEIAKGEKAVIVEVIGNKVIVEKK